MSLNTTLVPKVTTTDVFYAFVYLRMCHAMENVQNFFSFYINVITVNVSRGACTRMLTANIVK